VEGAVEGSVLSVFPGLGDFGLWLAGLLVAEGLMHLVLCLADIKLTGYESIVSERELIILQINLPGVCWLSS